MKITSSEYVKSYKRIQDIDKSDFPAVAFIGRSNVGKSSLINHLLNRKRLVKTSSTPGKTQLINFFLINKVIHFVDLPGYGYANVPFEIKQSWQTMIEEFLLNYSNLKLVIQLTDIRHNPSKHDIEFQKFLKIYQLPNQVIANKSDKLKKSQQKKALVKVKKDLELEAVPIAHSAFKKIGKPEIWQIIDGYLSSSGF